MKVHEFAIIGCGRIAQRHAEEIGKVGGRLAAVCDIIQKKAESLAARYSCRSYRRLEDLLANVQKGTVVSICTPNYLHAEQTIISLSAGMHVICEKPMAIYAADCDRMIRAAEAAQKRLFIVKQNRFNPPVAALKKAIQEDRLGRIINVQLSCFWNRNLDYYRSSDWKGRVLYDGGTLYTQFSHFIDLIIWLVGDVARVQAITGNLLHQDIIEFEDTGVVALEFMNGALGTINYTVNSYKKNMEGSITVFGEKGTVKIGGQYLNILEYQSIDGYEITGLPESRPANEYGFYQGSMSNHDKVYQNVTDVLNGRSNIATTAEEGKKTVELIEEIYIAAGRRENRTKGKSHLNE
jgi:UDP-N-acetyl-2-amino-2-deoxyglucuronate dehydrogenase